MMEWGVGIVQKKEKEDKLLELEKEKHRPFARLADDVEMNEYLKEQERWGDPMALFEMVMVLIIHNTY